MSTANELASNLATSIDAAVNNYCAERDRWDTTTKGNGFAVWCLQELFGISAEQAADAIDVGGAFDQSIDAFFVEDDTLLVVQVKYNAHAWKEIAKFKADMERLATTPPSTQRPAVLQTAAKLRSAHQAGESVRYYYITNQQFSGPDTEKSEGLQIHGQPLVVWDLDAVSQEISDRGAVRPAVQKRQTLKVCFESSPLRFDDSLIAPVSLTELAGMVQKAKQWLFSSNVRNYLAKSAVNKEIRETVTSSPAKFWRYNNGVTIVCDSWQEGVAGSNEFILSSPQVVNGCQTCHAIFAVIATLDDAQRQQLRGSVLCRVMQEPNDAERLAITRSTNRQNAVKNKDFFALEEFHRHLHGAFDSLSYFYEIQSGSFDQLSSGEKGKLTGDARFSHLKWAKRDYRIPAIEAAKCYAVAFQGEVSPCYANPGDLAPGGAAYEKLFPNDLAEEPLLFLLPFLTLKHCESEFAYKTRSGDFHSRARYFFVSAAFATLARAAVDAGHAPPGTERLGIDRLPWIREFFSRSELTERLFGLAEEAVTSFFEDSAIIGQVGQDMFAFLKQAVDRQPTRVILAQKIEMKMRGKDGKALVGDIQTLLKP